MTASQNLRFSSFPSWGRKSVPPKGRRVNAVDVGAVVKTPPFGNRDVRHEPGSPVVPGCFPSYPIMHRPHMNQQTSDAYHSPTLGRAYSCFKTRFANFGQCVATPNAAQENNTVSGCCSPAGRASAKTPERVVLTGAIVTCGPCEDCVEEASR